MNGLGIRLLTLLLCSFSVAPSQDLFPPVRLTSDTTREGFPTWSPDGSAIICTFFDVIEGSPVGGLLQIDVAGRRSHVLTRLFAEHPDWSPDGRLIVLDANMGGQRQDLAGAGNASAAGLPDSVRVQSGSLPRWSPSGRLILFKEGAPYWASIVDVKSGAVTRIFREEGRVSLPGCWTSDGRHILVSAMDRATRASKLWKVSIEGGSREPISGLREGFYRYAVLSPDDSLLVYAVVESQRVGLWIRRLQGGPSIPLAVWPDHHNECPAWSPDGTRLAFASGRTGRGDIYVMKMDRVKLREEFAKAETR